MRKERDKTGMIQIGFAAFAARIGETDKVYDLIDKCDFSPLSRPGGRHLPGDAGLQLLFEWHAKALRRDPRFAKLCAKLGLANYYLDSGHWPDCVTEVAPYYDFRKECADAVK